MSIIFGVKAADDLVVEESYLRKLAESTDRYAPDGTFILLSANVGMGFQAYQTHERSRLEVQPLVDPHGNMLTFDGRLDNHEELRESLSLPNQAATDSEIVVAAFRRWGERCFARLTGDWALALWSQRAEELYLARDHAGTRTLYYELREDRILWATYLETFFVERSTRVLDEVYAACYLACRPIRDLTPYKGIHGVPPAHYLRIQKHKISRRPHWNWLAKSRFATVEILTIKSTFSRCSVRPSLVEPDMVHRSWHSLAEEWTQAQSSACQTTSAKNKVRSQRIFSIRSPITTIGSLAGTRNPISACLRQGDNIQESTSAHRFLKTPPVLQMISRTPPIFCRAAADCILKKSENSSPESPEETIGFCSQG